MRMTDSGTENTAGSSDAETLEPESAQASLPLSRMASGLPRSPRRTSPAGSRLAHSPPSSAPTPGGSRGCRRKAAVPRSCTALAASRPCCCRPRGARAPGCTSTAACPSCQSPAPRYCPASRTAGRPRATRSCSRTSPTSGCTWPDPGRLTAGRSRGRSRLTRPRCRAAPASSASPACGMPISACLPTSARSGASRSGTRTAR